MPKGKKKSARVAPGEPVRNYARERNGRLLVIDTLVARINELEAELVQMHEENTELRRRLLHHAPPAAAEIGPVPHGGARRTYRRRRRRRQRRRSRRSAPG